MGGGRALSPEECPRVVAERQGDRRVHGRGNPVIKHQDEVIDLDLEASITPGRILAAATVDQAGITGAPGCPCLAAKARRGRLGPRVAKADRERRAWRKDQAGQRQDQEG